MMLFFVSLVAQTVPLDNPDLSFGWLFAKMLVAMIVIVALAFVFVKFVLPRFQVGSRRRNSRIEIIDRFGLETRKALYIIRVGKKLALVSSTDHNVQKICDLTEEDLS